MLRWILGIEADPDDLAPTLVRLVSNCCNIDCLAECEELGLCVLATLACLDGSEVSSCPTTEEDAGRICWV